MSSSSCWSWRLDAASIASVSSKAAVVIRRAAAALSMSIRYDSSGASRLLTRPASTPACSQSSTEWSIKRQKYSSSLLTRDSSCKDRVRLYSVELDCCRSRKAIIVGRIFFLMPRRTHKDTSDWRPKLKQAVRDGSFIAMCQTIHFMLVTQVTYFVLFRINNRGTKRYLRTSELLVTFHNPRVLLSASAFLQRLSPLWLLAMLILLMSPSHGTLLLWILTKRFIHRTSATNIIDGQVKL